MTLNELLKAWHQQPSESLRTLILAHDEREPLPGLRGLEQLKTAQVIERLEEFKGKKAKDPRLTRALEELVLHAPWSADSSKPVWRAIFDAIARTADPRFTALRPEFKVRPTMQEWLGKQFAAAIAKLPGAFSETKDEAKWKDALAKVPAKKVKAGAHDEAGLFAAVYANPRDDAPRLVLADFLTEKGDPRGEFISLQCGKGDAKREKALLKAHGKHWLGALAPVLGVDVEFRRGFPARGLVKFKAERDVQKYGALPEWATFEELTWSTPGAGSFEQRQWYQFIGPAFRHLVRADGPWLPRLLEANVPFERLEELTASFPAATHAKQLGESKNFPRLHTLAVESQVPNWLEPLREMKQLKTLRLNRWSKLEQWLDLAASLPIDSLWHGELLELKRNAARAFTRATVHVPSKLPQRWDVSLPDNAIDSLEVVGGGLPPAELKKLQAKVGPVKPREVRAPDALPEVRGFVHLAWLDEARVLFPNGGMFYVVDVSGPKPKVERSFPTERLVSDVMLLADGTLLAATPAKLVAIDPKSGEVKWQLSHAHQSSSIFALSLDGKRVSRGKAGVFDLEGRAAIPAPKGAKDDTRAPDDSFWLRWVSLKPYEVRLPGAKHGLPLEGGARWVGLVPVPGGFVACSDAGLVKWSAETGKQLAVVAPPKSKKEDRGTTGFAPVTSNDRHFVGALESPASVVLATLPDLNVVGRLKVEELKGLAVANDGKRVAVWDEAGLRVASV